MTIRPAVIHGILPYERMCLAAFSHATDHPG